MRLEATGNPFLYRWPGGEVRLEPGKPIDLPDERAKRLLSKAPGKVRVCLPTLRPGDLVTWTRGDGSQRKGSVDFVYSDTDGKQWAFVCYGQTWAAVDRKLLTVVTP